jgi:hypothetical protein
MKYLFPTLLAAAALPSIAAAQVTPQQGELAVGRSEGVIGLTLNVAETARIQVNGLNDLTFDTDKGSAPLPKIEPFCVYMDESGTYDVTVTAQPFKATGLTDLPFNLAYTAYDLQGAQTHRESETFDGTTTQLTLTGLTPSDMVDCPNGDSAEFSINLGAIANQAGTFSTTVTILVEPS